MVWLMEKTTLYLPRDLQRRLRAAARERDCAQAEIVRVALDAYLAEGRPRLEIVGIGNDPGLSAADSEDWLRREWSEP